MPVRYYSDMVHMRTCVYRIYDAEGSLLYVGMSLNPEGRVAKHRQQSWFERAAEVTVQWYPGREEAKAAEREAIRTESPKHNITRPGTIVWREID